MDVSKAPSESIATATLASRKEIQHAIIFVLGSKVVKEISPLGAFLRVAQMLKKYREHKILSMKIKDYIPLSEFEIIDDFASNLHQQGKTTDGIALMEEHYQQLCATNFSNDFIEKEMKEREELYGLNHPELSKLKCLLRISKFHFFLDDFESALKSINRVDTSKFSQKDIISVDKIFSYFVDKWSIAVEFGDDDLMRKIIEQFLIFIPDKSIQPLSNFNMYTRSKYLSTWGIINNDGNYSFDMEVNIKRPCRVENERPKPATERVHKLTDFYIKCFYSDLNGEKPFKTNTMKGTPEFSLELIIDDENRKASLNWYLLYIELYVDELCSNRIGRHYQIF